jgi:hypothetical protein
MMNMNLMNTGEEIDRLITVDIGARCVVRKLYQAARDLTYGPLCLEAANRIKDKVKPNDTVLIITGFPQLPSYVPETDGPVGAAAMARAVSFGLGAFPIIVTDRMAVSCMNSTLRAMELNVMSESEVLKGVKSTTAIPFPPEASEAKADEILSAFNPSAVIAIEKVGRNHLGVYHNMRGLDVSREAGQVDAILDGARADGVLTVGIGDGGNEIGMGNILDEVKRSVPNASKCQCPCGGGIAAVTKADLLVVASVSNWGGYGIETCIDMLQGKVDAIHSGDVEKRCIDACVSTGAIDGMRGIPEPSVDGISADVNASLMNILRTMASRNA